MDARLRAVETRRLVCCMVVGALCLGRSGRSVASAVGTIVPFSITIISSLRNIASSAL